MSVQAAQSPPSPHFPLPDVIDEENDNEGERTAALDESLVAMELSTKASSMLHAGQYREALEAYGAALQIYTERQGVDVDGDDGYGLAIVTHCNIASCLRNMGAIYRLLKDHGAAVQHWKRAEDLYRRAKREVAEYEVDDVGDVITDRICLDALMIETLQSRAVLHYKYMEDPTAAIRCHEEVVDLLVSLNESQEWDNLMNNSVTLESVTFGPLTKKQHTTMLILSLESLGSLYRSSGHPDEGMHAFEESLDILKERQHEDPQNDRILVAMAHVLRNLSEIYLERGDMDRAVEALHDAMDIKLSRSEQPTPEALEAMDKMGLAYEQLKNLDKALACYEKVLLARSRFLGETHVDVAQSLVNVARVMEHQGNVEGSMDLYRAAHAIYSGRITSNDFDVEGEDALSILRLVPAVLDQGRYGVAVAYLNKCLEASDSEEMLDKSQIFYYLGEAYIGMQDYVSATICLVEATKVAGSVKEEEIMVLLAKVEALQRDDTGSSTGSDSSSHTSVSRSYNVTADESSMLDIDLTTDDDNDPAILSESDLNSDVVRDSSLLIAHGNSSLGTWSPVRKKEKSVASLEMLSAKSESSSKRRLQVDLPADVVDEDEEATAFYDSEFEAGFENVPRSDVSSIFHMPDDLSIDSIPKEPLTIEPPPAPAEPVSPSLSLGKRQLPRNASPGRSSNVTRSTLTTRLGRSWSRESPSPRETGSRMRGFRFRGGSPRKDRRARSMSLQSRLRRSRQELGLEEKEDPPEETLAGDPLEQDYHAAVDGPVQYVSFRSESWESSVSQITVRFDGNPNSSRDNSQEWWWGVTSEGFGRWFPTTYFSQAVEAAEGFLSAKAIHAKVKPTTSPLDFLSDDEDEALDEGGGLARSGENPSQLGISEKTSIRRTLGRIPEIKVPDEKDDPSGPNTPRHDSVFSSPSPRRRQMGEDLIKEISACETRMKEEEERLGTSDPIVATSLFTLAVLHSRNRAVGAAVESATAALRIQKANGNTPDAIRSLHFLADLCLHQKQYKSSLTYYVESLRLESSYHGLYSEEAAKTLNCIGTVRSLQNEFQLAMDAHQEALRILKECHGEDLKHPHVAETLCHIGSVYYRERNSLSNNTKAKNDDYGTFIEAGMLEIIGRAHEDRGHYKMALSFFEEKLQFLASKGEEKENLEEVAVTLNSLGMLSARAGLYGQAVDFYERALTIQLRVGCDDIQLATARVLTGSAHFQLGSWRKAQKLLQDALGSLQKELGPKHETVAAARYQIGLIQAATCDYDNAMKSLTLAREIQYELLGEDHPATLRTRREIGNIYAVYDAEMETAFGIFQEVLAAQRRVHGNKHPNLAETLHSVGCAHAKKGAYSEALKVLEDCYYMRVEFLSWDHPLQASTLYEIAKIHLKRGRIKKALHICDVVLGIRSESLSDKHFDVGRTLVTKGSCHVANGDIALAVNSFEDALPMLVEVVGERHPAVAELYTEWGLAHLRKCQFEEARTTIEKSLAIYRSSNLDEDHPAIRDAEEKLERVEREEMLYV